MSELIKTAPEKIYLCVSDDESSKDESFPEYHGEVTWADHKAVSVTVEYVRSDLSEKAPAGYRLQPISEFDVLNEVIFADSKLREKVLELCETIIDAEDCGALVDAVMDFNLPRQIREIMGEA